MRPREERRMGIRLVGRRHMIGFSEGIQSDDLVLINRLGGTRAVILICEHVNDMSERLSHLVIQLTASARLFRP